MSYSSKWIFKSTATQMAKLMHLDETAAELWTNEDLAEMVQHQLATRMDFDLPGLLLDSPKQKAANDSITRAVESGLVTFGDLFRNPHSPRDLLELSKKFFKRRAPEPSSGDPEQMVSFLFYALTILLARMRIGANISRLTDEQLLQIISSMAKRRWVADEIRTWLFEARKRIVTGMKK